MGKRTVWFPVYFPFNQSIDQKKADSVHVYICHMRTIVLVYENLENWVFLDFWGSFVGFDIPAPWSSLIWVVTCSSNNFGV
jgi:hypothetical protein